MTVYEKSNCGRCRSTLQGWDVAARGIGVPFLKCPKCGAINDRSTVANEWDLMPGEQKLTNVLLTLYWGSGYGLAVSVGIGFASMEIWPYIENIDLASVETALILGVGLTIGIFGNFLLLHRHVQRSRERMRDQGYVYTLKGLYPDAFQD